MQGEMRGTKKTMKMLSNLMLRDWQRGVVYIYMAVIIVSATIIYFKRRKK